MRQTAALSSRRIWHPSAATRIQRQGAAAEAPSTTGAGPEAGTANATSNRSDCCHGSRFVPRRQQQEQQQQQRSL